MRGDHSGATVRRIEGELTASKPFVDSAHDATTAHRVPTRSAPWRDRVRTLARRGTHLGATRSGLWLDPVRIVSRVGADVGSVEHVELRPLRDLAVKRAAADAHQLGGLGAIAARFQEGFAEEVFFIFLDGE